MKPTLFTIALLLPSVGCLTIKPIGPLANKDAPAIGKPDAAHAAVMAPKDLPTMPAVVEGPRPPRPAYEVTPGEVSDATAQECAAKLRKELDADRAAADALPRYPEVSRVKR